MTPAAEHALGGLVLECVMTWFRNRPGFLESCFQGLCGGSKPSLHIYEHTAACLVEKIEMPSQPAAVLLFLSTKDCSLQSDGILYLFTADGRALAQEHSTNSFNGVFRIAFMF